MESSEPSALSMINNQGLRRFDNQYLPAISFESLPPSFAIRFQDSVAFCSLEASTQKIPQKLVMSVHHALDEIVHSHGVFLTHL